MQLKVCVLVCLAALAVGDDGDDLNTRSVLFHNRYPGGGQGGIFPGNTFPGQGGNRPGNNFPGNNFPGGNFPNPGGGHFPNPGGHFPRPQTCRYWCRTPEGQAYCCEGGDKPQGPVGTKNGRCPPIRPHCPPVRFEIFGPPQQCSNDYSCNGNDKCCFDKCLGEHVCKAPINIYG